MITPTNERTCPIPGCSNKCKRSQVCCRRHWFKLPADKRAEIWRLYRSKPGSEKHRSAVFSAIRWLAEEERKGAK